MKEWKSLTKQEVEEQKRLGNVNISPKPLVDSNFKIICKHVFNLFNAYNFIIAFALLMVRAYTSLFFVFVVLSNTIIRSFQEIKSKKMVADLNLIVSPKTNVLRDGQLELIDNEDIVLHDVIYFETGNQISADSIVLSDGIEVDESLLSGEADPVYKKIGDELLSGSFIVSGACYAKVIHIGVDNYAMKLTNEARHRKPVESELINTFNKVTRMTSWFIIPLGFLMLYQAYFVRAQGIENTIIYTSTALLGMLPKGLVFLTSLSLAASVIKLGKKKTLIQELFSIETLSRVDVLCLDKTGTLTQGKMQLQEVHILDQTFPYAFEDVMKSYIYGARDNNTTFKTMQDHFGKQEIYKTTERIPFSSIRKWSAVQLQDIGTIIIGAPEIIMPSLKLSKEIDYEKEQGSRILLVASSDHFEKLKNGQFDAKALAILVIKDPIREDAKEALTFFRENDVDVKVISGDHPQTVSAIAKQAGLTNAEHYLDASTLQTDEQLEQAILQYDVIGRATPYQKHNMILCLQKHGNKVAMTGDGVNDVLALKDADVSIAMGSGSDAARQISQVIIIDGQLSTLVDIVREGRLVINNITRSASMYYLKTIYTICLSIVAVLMNMPFPFIPFQMTMIDMFIEGFPSFMIAFERNINKPKESIPDHALRFSLPNALTIVMSVIAAQVIASFIHLPEHDVFTILYFTTAFISLQMIYRIYKPLNIYRGTVLILDIIGFFISLPIFWRLLEIAPINQTILTVMAIIIVTSIPIIWMISKLVNHVVDLKQEKQKLIENKLES